MKIKNVKKSKFIFPSIIFLFSLFIACNAQAATLYISPANVSTTLGSTFTVSVETDTKSKAVNVAEATISFSSDKLQVVSATPGSTFTLQTPGSPLKGASKVFFSAGLQSPGYKGSSGVLGKITFKSIATGNASIDILGGKVLLNDGLATDVLTGTSDSTILILPAVIENNTTKQPEQLAPTVSPLNTEQQPVQEPVQQPEQQQVQQIFSENLQPSNNIYTIIINLTVEDLVHIIYILIAVTILLLILVVYLIVRNLRVNKEMKKISNMAKHKDLI